MQIFAWFTCSCHPTSFEADEFAGTHMRGARDNVLIVVGCCSVEYSGRARSTLGWGARIVIIKPDGSVLVHQRAGREPVNWQPPGTRVRYQTETDDNPPLLWSLCRVAIQAYTLIQMPVFQSHQSCTMTSMRRLKTTDANMIGGL